MDNHNIMAGVAGMHKIIHEHKGIAVQSGHVNQMIVLGQTRQVLALERIATALEAMVGATTIQWEPGVTPGTGSLSLKHNPVVANISMPSTAVYRVSSSAGPLSVGFTEQGNTEAAPTTETQL